MEGNEPAFLPSFPSPEKEGTNREEEDEQTRVRKNY